MPDPEPTPLSQTPAAKVRVFLVDDHPIFRDGLINGIKAHPDLEVVGFADSAPEALSRLRTVSADVAIIDISLSGSDGLELLKHLRAEQPALRPLVLSMHSEDVQALRVLRAGAGGYLMKSESAETVIAAVRRVSQGQTAVSPRFEQQLIFRALNRASGVDPLAQLSDRELEILRHLGEGLSTSEIAAVLHVSPKTVESHRLNLKQKLELNSSTELVQFALQLHRETIGVADDRMRSLTAQ